MKILLLGSNGMLGSDCKTVFEKDYYVIAPDKKELDIISWDKVIECLQNISPDIIVNCAGLTDVDKSEKEEFALRKINVEGPRNLAQGAARFNCKLIHISCDHIYNGQKSIPQPYFEDDPADPISAYGKSKMHSETAVKENAPNYTIVRSSWLYGINGKSYIKSILMDVLKKMRKEIKVAADQVGSPTWTFRLALQIKELIKRGPKGTYHASSEGYCSRFDYAQYVLNKLNIKASLEPCNIADDPRSARGPINCIMENRLLKKQGLNIMPEWQKDMDIFLDKYGEELVAKAKAGEV